MSFILCIDGKFHAGLFLGCFENDNCGAVVTVERRAAASPDTFDDCCARDNMFSFMEEDGTCRPCFGMYHKHECM